MTQPAGVDVAVAGDPIPATVRRFGMACKTGFRSLPSTRAPRKMVFGDLANLAGEAAGMVGPGLDQAFEVVPVLVVDG